MGGFITIIVFTQYLFFLITLLNLHEYFLDLLNQGIISMGHARSLVNKTPNDFDDQTLSKIVKGKISVRDLENKIGKHFNVKIYNLPISIAKGLTFLNKILVTKFSILIKKTCEKFLV